MNAVESFIARKRFGVRWGKTPGNRSTDGVELCYRHWPIARWEGLKHLVLITVRLPEADFEWPTVHAIERTQRELYKFIEANDGYTFERQDSKRGDV